MSCKKWEYFTGNKAAVTANVGFEGFCSSPSSGLIKLEHRFYEEELGGILPGEEEARGDLIILYKSLKETVARWRFIF